MNPEEYIADRERRDPEFRVLSESDYLRLTGERSTLREYLLNGPDLSNLDLERDPSLMREVTIAETR